MSVYVRPPISSSQMQADTLGAGKGHIGTKNILIVDPNPVFRRGLVSVLQEQTDFNVLADVSSIAEASTTMIGAQPDIIILDSEPEDPGGTRAIAELYPAFPGAKVFVLATSTDQEYIMEAMKAGAKGYVLKDASVSELLESIRLIAHGGAVVYPHLMVGTIISIGLSRENKTGFSALSPREKEVLALVAQGSRNKEIAATCFVSEATVKAHVRRILDKLCVKNRAQAVGLALSRGLINSKGPWDSDGASPK